MENTVTIHDIISSTFFDSPVQGLQPFQYYDLLYNVLGFRAYRHMNSSDVLIRLERTSEDDVV